MHKQTKGANGTVERHFGCLNEPSDQVGEQLQDLMHTMKILQIDWPLYTKLTHSSVLELVASETHTHIHTWSQYKS